MSEVVKQEKNPVDVAKKQKLTRIFTFVGGGVGIVVLILFAVLILKPTPKVTFAGRGSNMPDAIVINSETFKVEKPADPKRKGYDFVGWAKEDDSIVDFETEKFSSLQKEFGWFGKVKEMPLATTLTAKWELHKYKVELINANNGEPIVLLDENENEIEFYVISSIIIEEENEKFVDDYIKNIENIKKEIMGEEVELSIEELKQAEEFGTTLASDKDIPFEAVWNIAKLTNIEGVKLSSSKDDIDAGEIKRTDLFDKDGNNVEVVATIYVHGYEE